MIDLVASSQLKIGDSILPCIFVLPYTSEHTSSRVLSSILHLLLTLSFQPFPLFDFKRAVEPGPLISMTVLGFQNVFLPKVDINDSANSDDR